MSKVYKIEGMTCGGCASSVKNAILKRIPNAQVDVQFDQDQAKVGGEHNPADVRAAVEAAGFDFGGQL